MKFGIVVLLMIMFGCDKPSLLAPSDGGNSNGTSTVAPVPAPVPDLPVAIPTQCETIDITARRVLSVSATEVVLFVNAEYDGKPDAYVRLRDSYTGVSYGDHPLGKISLSLPPGDYRIFVFVEAEVEGKVIQCDGSLEFTIPAPPPPVVEECEGEPVWVIDEEAWIEEIETCVPQQDVCSNSYEFKEHRISSSNEWNNYYRGLCEGLGGSWSEQFYHSKGDQCTFVGSPTSSFWEKGTWFQLKDTIETCVPVPDVCTVEEVEHPEVGHFEDPCKSAL